MAERFKAPVLKTGVRLIRTVGSNPTPSAKFSPGNNWRKKYPLVQKMPAGLSGGYFLLLHAR